MTLIPLLYRPSRVGTVSLGSIRRLDDRKEPQRTDLASQKGLPHGTAKQGILLEERQSMTILALRSLMRCILSSAVSSL